MAQVMIQITDETEEFVANRRKQYLTKGVKKTKADILFDMANNYPKLFKLHHESLKTFDDIRNELRDMYSKKTITDDALNKLIDILDGEKKEE